MKELEAVKMVLVAKKEINEYYEEKVQDIWK